MGAPEPGQPVEAGTLTASGAAGSASKEQSQGREEKFWEKQPNYPKLNLLQRSRVWEGGAGCWRAGRHWGWKSSVEEIPFCLFPSSPSSFLNIPGFCESPKLHWLSVLWLWAPSGWHPWSSLSPHPSIFPGWMLNAQMSSCLTVSPLSGNSTQLACRFLNRPIMLYVLKCCHPLSVIWLRSASLSDESIKWDLSFSFTP